jgi:hypothetical protein
MNTRFRRIAVFVGAASLAGGAGIGVAAQRGSSTARPVGHRPRDDPARPGRRRRGLDLSALASECRVLA